MVERKLTYRSTAKHRKGPQRTAQDHILSPERSQRTRKDIRNTGDDSHDVTIQWYTLPTALVLSVFERVRIPF